MGRLYQIDLQTSEADEVALRQSLRFRGADGTFFVPSHDLRVLQVAGTSHRVVREIDEADLPVRFILPHDGAVNDPPPEGARLAVLARLLAEGRVDGRVHVRFLGRNRTVPPDGFVLDRAGGGRRYVWQVVPEAELSLRPSLESRFDALRSAFGRADTRVVVSLGSGGVKLFGHAALLRLLESIGVADEIDEFWGTSGGALAALLYCHGLSPQAIEQTGYDLYAGRYQLPIHPSKLQVVRNLMREAFLPHKDATNAGFVDVAKGLSRMLDQYCDTLDPNRPFYCIAFNLRECRSDVLTSEPVPEHLGGIVVRADAREAALASSAVPILFVPRAVQCEGGPVPYIDGSVTEDVPLLSVVEKFDADRAAGVETRSRLLILSVKLSGTTEAQRTLDGHLGKIRVLQLVASAGMETMHRQSLALIDQRPDVQLLPLDLRDPHADFFDLSRIPEYIRTAKERFPAQLAEIEAALRTVPATLSTCAGSSFPERRVRSSSG